MWWKRIVLVSNIRAWRNLSRMQRRLISSRVVRPASTHSSSLLTTCLRYRGPRILPAVSPIKEAIGCTAALSAVEPLLKSNGHRYYHHDQYHRHRRSHTGSTSATNSTFGVIPMLGAGLLLCRNSSQGKIECCNGVFCVCISPASLSLSLPP